MTTPIPNYPRALAAKFKELFNQQPLIIRSPGRINLIGEHTDYNNGFVLPAAINKAIYFGIQKRDDNEIHLYSMDYDDAHQTILNNLVKSGKLWPDYILGVVEQVIRMDKMHDGEIIKGFNVVFGGDIPPGAGLSSSAALECATAFALNQLFGLGYEKMDMVRMAQAAENQFVGVKCGIMDQFASMFGRKGHLMRLDCKTLDHAYIPFRADDIKIVLFDTQVKHSLASSAYNERREQCEEGVRLVGSRRSDVGSLRDATENMLLEYVKPVNELVYNRCSFVVAENERLLSGCKDLENNDIISFSKKMFETHNGLSKLYEVSCKELDILVDLVKDNPDVLGARMMGGGFGGCTINLIKSAAVESLVDEVSKEYKKQTGVDMLVYEVGIEDGTKTII